MSEKEFKEEASTEILENEAENAPEEKKEETFNLFWLYIINYSNSNTIHNATKTS